MTKTALAQQAPCNDEYDLWNVGDAATDSAGSPVTVTKYMMAFLGKADNKFAQVPKPLEEFARLDKRTDGPGVEIRSCEPPQPRPRRPPFIFKPFCLTSVAFCDARYARYAIVCSRALV